MAQLAGDLSKAIMGQTDAEKAFRPWCGNQKVAKILSNQNNRSFQKYFHKYFQKYFPIKTRDLFIGGIYSRTRFSMFLCV